MKKISFLSLVLVVIMTLIGCSKPTIYDFSNVSFTNKTYEYDGTEKVLEITGEAPEGLTLEYINNKRLEVGVSNAKAMFYNGEELVKEYQASLIIVEPTINLEGISFEDQTYIYDGQEHSLLLQGNIPGTYKVEYTNNKLTEVGASLATAKIIDYKGVIVKEYEAILTVLANDDLKYQYLSDIPRTYNSVGYGNLVVDKANNNEKLSLKTEEGYQEFSKGFFAHAYSVLAFDELADFGYETFSAYVGINKTGQANNSQASVTFKVYLDNELAYTSSKHTKDSTMELVELDIRGVNNVTLIADDMGANGNDHAVWADAKFSYVSSLKPQIIASPIELPSEYQLTEENLLELVSAYTRLGEDISDDVTCQYQKMKDGNYEVTYKVISEGRATIKKVPLTILNEERFIEKLDAEAMKTPFANYVYYGYWLLRPEVRKAYDVVLTELLNADLTNLNQTKVTVNLQEKGIYIYPGDASTLKHYMSYDESRVYFIYDWRKGLGHGVSTTTKNGYLETISIETYNGQGGYYYQHDLEALYAKAEEQVSTWMVNIKDDMTDYQALKYLQRKLQDTTKYANVDYADGFYGIFNNKRAICSGYAKGLEYLGHRLGIKISYDSGWADGMGHAWNIVYVNNQWYMSDATWGKFFVGQKYFHDTNRWSGKPFSKMPTLVYDEYNLNLLEYPLASFTKSELALVIGDEIDLNSLVAIKDNVKNLISITSIQGDVNFTQGGNYERVIKAELSNGNILEQTIKFYVYQTRYAVTKEQLSVPSNSAETQLVSGSLWDGSKEVAQEGFKLKAFSGRPSYIDIAVDGASAFSINFSIDKSIRDNTSYGHYANATVTFYVDGVEVAKSAGLGWKTAMRTISIKDLEDAQTIRIEVTGSSGQDRVAFGLPTFYK